MFEMYFNKTAKRQKMKYAFWCIFSFKELSKLRLQINTMKSSRRIFKLLIGEVIFHAVEFTDILVNLYLTLQFYDHFPFPASVDRIALWRLEINLSIQCTNAENCCWWCFAELCERNLSKKSIKEIDSLIK